MPAFDTSVLQTAGGWLLLADMILAALLFACWERAGRIQLKFGRRKG